MDIYTAQEKSPYKADFVNVPAIMTESPAEKVSDRYKFISPRDIIPVMAEQNWWVNRVQQSRAVKEGNNAFTKFMMSFRCPDFDKSLTPIVGETFPELQIRGSHDATSCYEQTTGIYRVWCSNGCVCMDSALGSAKVRHTGDDVYDVVAILIADMIKRLPNLTNKITDWRNIDLNRDQQEAYAQTAITLRWDADSGSYVDPRSMLRPIRVQDRETDLWTTYNVLQEKLIKGAGKTGMPVYKVGENGERVVKNRKYARRRNMDITSVTEDKRLNQALWQLTEKMAELV